MNPSDILKTAFKSLKDNGFRSILSMLGVIIGVAAIVAVVSIGNGAENKVLNEVNAWGTNIINVTPAISKGNAVKMSIQPADLFSYDMAGHIKVLCPGVEEISPFIESWGALAVYNKTNLRTNVRATTGPFFDMINLKLALGRIFDESDVENKRPVAILGSKASKDLFGKSSPLGKSIKMILGDTSLDLVVIGVLEPKGNIFMVNYDSYIFIPITTWMGRIQRTEYVNGFIAKSRSDEAVAQLQYFFHQRLGNIDKVTVSSQDAILAMISKVANTFKVLLGGLSSIALFVGGIGIMNISLISVKERTREIGIRKALGAKRKAILMQFLLEAFAISLIGGVVGLGIGSLGAFILASIGGWPFVVTPLSAFIAITFSTFVGLFFGIYPASRAAGLDPVMALNYE